jgi:hypothetical protein
LVGLWCGLCVVGAAFFGVLCGFVLDFDVLALFLLRCIFYYRALGLHYARGLTDA